MQHQTRSLASSLVLLFLLGAVVPARAASWPLGHMLPLHPGASADKDPRITVQIYNRGGLIQQVRVAGRVYTLLPYNRLTLKAPEGTEAFAASKGFKHRKGDLLFAFTPDRNNEIVRLD
ncbi:MAG TPA: hypothetical protein VGN01_02395 [Acidobacteriaceae bacterium]|jgi:hypothetical protein